MSRVTRANESCHTYGWVMTHTWTDPLLKDLDNGWVTSHTHTKKNVRYHRVKLLIYKWVVSHVTYIPSHWCEWVTNHTWLTWVVSHSWLTYQVTHIWMSRVTRGLHTKWVVSHSWLKSQVTHVDESRNTHDLHANVNESCLIRDWRTKSLI